MKAQGINLKGVAAAKRLESGSDSDGLEFVSTFRVKSREDQQDEEKAKMLQISGQVV